MSLPTGVLNFDLITKLPHHHLPSLFPVHGVAVSPPARPRAAPSPLPRPCSSQSISAPPRGTPSLRARRGRPSTRHGDEHAKPCRAPLRSSLAASALLSSLPFASQTSPLPPPLLPFLLHAPNRAPRGVQSRPLLAISAAAPRSPRSSPLRPSSCPTSPAASFLASH